MKGLKRHFRILCLIAFCMVLTVTSFASQIAFAKESEESYIQDKAAEAVGLLEKLLNLSYEERLSELKDKCVSEGYDYSMSLAAFTEYGNPFDNCDYMEVLGAYCMTVGKDAKATILDFSFLDVAYTEDTIEEAVPYKAYTYSEVSDGLYQREHLYYITEECDIDIYEETEDGLYIKTGTEHIIPEYEVITYLVPTFYPVSAASILSFYGMDIEDESVSSELDKRVYKLKNTGLSNDILRQNVFISLAKGDSILTEDALEQVNIALSETSGNTNTLISTAASLIGRIPYLWGGKAKMAGYDNTWWTFNEAGKQKGLDCSGFVQWAYITAGYPAEVYENLLSTSAILTHFEEVSYENLQIGDVGLLNHGEAINHTGIYIGNGYFIHCSGSADTVTVSYIDDVNFTIFKHVCNLDDYSITPTEVIYSSNAVTEEDAYLLAALVEHEAAGEGLNGKIAVAEVVLNRLISDSYPDTVTDVIYDTRQFENVEEIESIVPKDEDVEIAREVLSGTLKILNDTSILYFNNPKYVSAEKLYGLEAVAVINNHTFYRKAENL